jgi:hypothetical protein
MSQWLGCSVLVRCEVESAAVEPLLPVEPATTAWGGWRREMGGLMEVAGEPQSFTYSASLTDT